MSQRLVSDSKAVCFNDVVAIRTHTMTIGMNPACSLGTPVTLDWNVVNEKDLSLQKLEQQQDARYAVAMEERLRKRRKHEYAPQGPPIQKLNYYDRQAILLKEGCTQQEIDQGEKNLHRYQRQRAWSTRGTFLVRTAEYASKQWRRNVQGQGTIRHKQRMVDSWYQHYGGRRS